ncbi:unnamed protein product [Phytomonas sp. EM1]|nr:unnamed protein product [Phytomonas sp. EM1]|eukprot:CCW64234.1 unnamed protein product [Phytomonas sp. isolate EM1]
MLPPAKKKWGAKTAWARAFFCLEAADGDAGTPVPPIPPEPHSSQTPREDRPPETNPPRGPPADDEAAIRPYGLEKTTDHSLARLERTQRKRERLAALNPRSVWRCRRCAMGLRLPVDPVSGRPSTLALVRHLEGEGDLSLRCSAGPLPYSPEADDPHERSPTAESEFTAAKRALERILQEASTAGGKGPRARGGAAVPRVFVVVENPKTPANVGGILRAMGCLLDPMNPEEGVQSRRSQHSAAAGFIFSGERLARAVVAQRQRNSQPSTKPSCERMVPLITGTDTQGAAAFIPQLCLPSLQVLFDVLKERRVRTAGGDEVAVVAVELARGATPLQNFVHPFSLASSTHSGSPHTSRQDEEGTLVPTEVKFARQLNHPTKPNPDWLQASTTVDADESAVSPSRQTPEAHQLDESITASLVFYLFGAEDSSISKCFLDQCKEVVFIPTYGSVNLSASVNVVLYDRVAKDLVAEFNESLISAEAMSYEERWGKMLAHRNPNNRLNFS